MSETGKKKRGRKPKNKIILNENPVFDTSLDDILIACVKKTKTQEDLVVAETIEPNDNDEIFQEYEGAIIDKCWNCSYEIDGEIYSHPISYSYTHTYSSLEHYSYAVIKVSESINNRCIQLSSKSRYMFLKVLKSY